LNGLDIRDRPHQIHFKLVTLARKAARA
jgi:hypothetical protein